MNEPWTVIVYAIVAGALMFVLEAVARQVDFDRINSEDPPWVSWARRSAFLIAEINLALTATAATSIYKLWTPSWVDIGLLANCVLILGVNVISLHLRTPRPPDHGYHELIGHRSVLGRYLVKEAQRQRKGFHHGL